MAEEKRMSKPWRGRAPRSRKSRLSPKKVHRWGGKQHQCQKQQEGSRQAHEYTVWMQKKPPAYSSELGYNCPSGCFSPMATYTVYAIPIQVSSQNLKMQQSDCRFTIDARLNREHWNRNGKSLETVDTQRLQGFSFGDPSEIRTPDTLIKSQVLYRLS